MCRLRILFVLSNQRGLPVLARAGSLVSRLLKGMLPALFVDIGVDFLACRVVSLSSSLWVYCLMSSS